jgi:hypothetical protein
MRDSLLVYIEYILISSILITKQFFSFHQTCHESSINPLGMHAVEEKTVHLYYYSTLLHATFQICLRKLIKPHTLSLSRVNPLAMHGMLVGRDTLLVFRTHFIPLLCVFYTLFTQPILLHFQQISKNFFLSLN